jgi:hypothetical protein
MAFKTINDFPESTSPSGNWFVLVDDGTGCYKKVKLSNLPGGGGTTTTTTSTTSSTTSTTSSTTTSCEATHPSAIAFIEAAGITSCIEKQAINQLVLDLVEYGIWTKMKAIYPFVGGTASSNAYNLKNVAANNLTFSGGGFTYASTGVTPNGTSSYADTGFNPSTDFSSSTSLAAGIYSRNNSTITGGAFHYQLGAYEGGGTNPEVGIFFWDDGAANQQKAVLGDQEFVIVNPKNSFSGFHVTTRTTNSSFKYFRNAVLQGTNTNVVTGALPNRDVYIFAANIGSASSFSTEELAFAFLSDGLSDTEANNLNTAVTAFQTTLGRAVV